MHFSLLIVTGLAAVATALPQRPGGGRGRFRGGQPSDANAQGEGVQAADLSGFRFPQSGAQPPAVATPENTQAGLNQGTAGEGDLNNQENNRGGATNNQGLGNANDNRTNIGNNGNQNGLQNGQDQNGLQNGQSQNGLQNGQNQNSGNQTTGAFDASLVPEFGVQAGQSPDGTGNCLGLNNVKIPCSCPPERQDFIKQVQAAVAAGNSAGVPVEFPLDDSSASKKTRIQTSIVVLQNLNGRGVGCPAAATTFLAQQAAA